MGIFDLFKKKKEEDTLISNDKKELITRPSSEISNTIIRNFNVHEDIKDLIWIGNGPMKNYQQEVKHENQFVVDGMIFTINFSNSIEPSLIDTNLVIAQIEDTKKVERPPYYPTYGILTDEQRGVYWKLLSNPYDTTIDIGYVFILYYGLERHLLMGNFEKAFDVILKLRDVHTNKSFQSYSGNALVLSAMYHQRPDMAAKFMKSLDKEYELSFSDNLYLLCTYSFDIPMRPNDIVRMTKTFEFDNKNYINKYPELFEETMQEIIKTKNGSQNIKIKDYITQTEFKKLKSQEIGIFANISLTDHKIKVPLFEESFKFKKNMYDILEATHEEVKVKLPQLRKNGEIEPRTKEELPKKILVFDPNTENKLLDQLKKSRKKPVDRHFAYMELQNFYYKYRDLGNLYIERCIGYCLADISQLDELNNAYKKNEVAEIREFTDFRTKVEINKEIAKIEIEGFGCYIPAFNRLAIIYEKKGQFEDAIGICNKGIDYYKKWGLNYDELPKRIEKLTKKMSKE